MCNSEIGKSAFDKEPLIEWVAKFLNYWEDEGMLYEPAATLIVEHILKFIETHYEGRQGDLIKILPEPSSLFDI